MPKPKQWTREAVQALVEKMMDERLAESSSSVAGHTPIALEVDDAWDALTLEVERINALSQLIEVRLADLSGIKSDPNADEIYGLSIVAESIRDKTAIVVAHANTLRPAKNGGAR